MKRTLLLLPLWLGPLAAAQPSLDELLDLAPPPAEEPAPPARGEDPPEAGLADLAGRLDPPADAGDAYRQALARMDAAAGLLADAPAGLPAARAQEEVLALLDQVLAAATPPPSGGGGGGEPGESPPPTDGDQPENGEPASQAAAGPAQPAAGAPSAAPGPGGDGAQEAASRGAAQDALRGGPLEAAAAGWGGLPPRLRDELTDGLDEPFSPVYREATEDYYRRLSRQAAEAQP